MPVVSKEQIAQAKQVDILSYLLVNEPYNIKRSGTYEYRLIDHDSLTISNSKWYWHSKGYGGRSALDFLIKVRGMGFVDAVCVLTDTSTIKYSFAQQVKESVYTDELSSKHLILPVPNINNDRAVAYLLGRGIDCEVINQCINAGTLYEDRKHSCVFVGTDITGTARFACLRGTSANFKQDATGSDKSFGFVLSSCEPSSRFVAVFESPIDALSMATLRKMETSTWDRYHYLALGGTSPKAILQFLNDNPNVDHVYLCLDNDRAGLDGMARIKSEIYKDAKLDKQVSLITIEPPKNCKDYNEVLQTAIQERKAQVKEGCYKQVDASI